jgi:hypothetical protein
MGKEKRTFKETLAKNSLIHVAALDWFALF